MAFVIRSSATGRFLDLTEVFAIFFFIIPFALMLIFIFFAMLRVKALEDDDDYDVSRLKKFFIFFIVTVISYTITITGLPLLANDGSISRYIAIVLSAIAYAAIALTYIGLPIVTIIMIVTGIMSRNKRKQ